MVGKKKHRKKICASLPRLTMFILLILCLLVFFLLSVYVNQVEKFYSLTFQMGKSLESLARRKTRFFINFPTVQELKNESSSNSSKKTNSSESMFDPQTGKLRKRPNLLFKILRKAEFVEKVTKHRLIPTERPQTCKKCFGYHFKYIIENLAACASYNTTPAIDVLILIFTIHENQFERQTLRETWLSLARNNTSNIRYVFLMGNSKKSKLEKALKEESRIYKDIVQVDFKESYNNLTYKTLIGLTWASTRCENAKFIMKTDDDVYVNIPGLINVLTKHGEDLQTKIGGSCKKRAFPHRKKGTKYYASEESYPQRLYPGYCSGTGYVTSMHVASDIIRISRNIPFFHLEDVYVSLCISKLGYSLMTLKGFHVEQYLPRPCTYRNLEFVMSHRISPEIMEWIWNKPCKEIYISKH